MVRRSIGGAGGAAAGVVVEEVLVSQADRCRIVTSSK
jgi:hypothetical protein